MARSRRPRSSRTSHKQVAAATPTALANNEVIVSLTPPPATTAAATAPPAAATPDIVTPTAAPITPAQIRGTKRGRGDENENDEDAFYGRKSAKSRNKGVKDLGRNEQEQKGTTEGEGPSTPAKGPAATSLRSSKRLKFDPEIHGVGLEARFLGLQDDGFEKMISPRKNVRTDREKEKLKRDWAESTETPRKIAKPKSERRKISTKTPKAGTKKVNPAQTKGSTEPHPLESESLPTSQDGEIQAANKPCPTPNPTFLTLEKRLQRLTSPVISNAPPMRPRTVGSSFPGSPAPVKSSKPLTKPSFELPGDAHMRKRAAEREERKKRMEEAETKKEETTKQQQLHERFKTHTEQRTAKKDPLQGSSKAPTHPNTPTAPAPKGLAMNNTIATNTKPEPLKPSTSRRLTMDEINQQLGNESELKEKKKVEEAVLLHLRQEAAEKGKESARLWAEQTKTKSMKN